MALFAIPFQWNESSYQNIISNKNGADGSIVEVYGIISERSLPHGRTSKSVRRIISWHQKSRCQYFFVPRKDKKCSLNNIIITANPIGA